jgi:hypothetical protein
MTSVFNNVLSLEDLAYINALSQVLEAKQQIEAVNSGKLSFSIPQKDSIRAALLLKLGLDLSHLDNIPMQWIKGDTAAHVDSGQSAFEQTYLVYLTSTPGEFVVDTSSYPIVENTAYIFNEGLSHKTVDTGSSVRLLIGPVSEKGFRVGSPLAYYPTEQDALNYTNALGYSGSYIVGNGGPYGGFTSWRLASNSNGTSSQLVVYNNGDTLINDGTYKLYPSIPCFLEGTKILCEVEGKDTYVPIEKLRCGALVKTSRDGYKRIECIGKGTLYNPGNADRTENRLYKCSPNAYPELKEDLYITGCHSILVDTISYTEKAETLRSLGTIFVTDSKYRLMASIDARAQPWNSEGSYTIWHFALEHPNIRMNYGVYANGLLVESCSINALKTKSNLSLLPASNCL